MDDQSMQVLPTPVPGIPEVSGDPAISPIAVGPPPSGPTWRTGKRFRSPPQFGPPNQPGPQGPVLPSPDVRPPSPVVPPFQPQVMVAG